MFVKTCNSEFKASGKLLDFRIFIEKCIEVSARCRIYDFFKMTFGKTPKAENSRKRESASCRIKKIVENSNRRGAEVPLFQKTAFGKMPKAPQIFFLFLLHILKNVF